MKLTTETVHLESDTQIINPRKTAEMNILRHVSDDQASHIAPVKTGTCKNCDRTEDWGKSSWCPSCGFYPATNGCIPGFETTLKPHEPENVVEHWWQLIPQWGWIAGGVSLAIIVLNIIGGDMLRGTPVVDLLALSEFSLGMCGVMIAHVLAYTYTVKRTDEFGAMSIFTKPFKLWKWVFREMPDSQSEVYLGIWCLVAMIVAPLFLGKLDPTRITDLYKVRKATKTNLAAAVKDKLKTEDGDGDLTGSVEEFSEKGGAAVAELSPASKGAAGDGANSEGLGDGKKTPPTEVKPEDKKLIQTDCVIIGFTLSSQTNTPEELILASLVNGTLQYVGKISTDKMTPGELKDLSYRLPKFYREEPMVAANIPNAHWLKPIMCVQVVHKDWTPSRKLVGAEYKEMLSDLDVSK
jgi:hypothetical protein